jgi:copper(I)-binding protein
MRKLISISSLLLATSVMAPSMACDLQVESAWIRTPPPGATAIAGYATLINTGMEVLRLQSLQANGFSAVEAHETLIENGVAKMRPLTAVEIPVQGKVTFAPDGKHFMLVNPKQPVSRGDVVSVTLRDATGCDTTVSFKVSDQSPGNATSDAGKEVIDHSKMAHSKMSH